MEFKPFPKLSRWSRDIMITEKIDGTNASIHIRPYGQEDYDPALDIAVQTGSGAFTIRAGSRTRWISPGDDNYSFAGWVHSNAADLARLGAGHHFGEWWGRGVQRNYSQSRKRFSLFNAGRWAAPGKCVLDGQESPPECCDVVPVLYSGPNYQADIEKTVRQLRELGSVAAPGFMQPEGIVIFHSASQTSYKKTITHDESPKSLVKPG